MPRARNLKPSFFKNEHLAHLGPCAQLLFEGLWVLSDREGRLEDRPTRIKAEIFPYYEVPVHGLLDSLARLEDPFIVRYEIDGKRYIQVIKFLKHNNPHCREGASTIPAPGKHRARTSLAGLKPESPILNPESAPAIPEEKKYAVPLPEEKPIDSLVMLYKVLQGVPHDYRKWDDAWGRWMQKAKELSEIFGGNFAQAYACLKEQAEAMNAKGYNWTFNTIIERAHLWKQKHGGDEYAHINRDRFLRDLIDQRKQKRIEGLRCVSEDAVSERADARNNGLHAPGADHPPLPTESPHRKERAGDSGNGRAVSRFSTEALEDAGNREEEPSELSEVWSGNGRYDE